MRRSSPLAILALLISGCASTQPALVYVDVDTVIGREHAADLRVPKAPSPPSPLAPAVVTQKGLAATTVTDRTIQRLQAAKKFIQQNRDESIQSLGRMLRRVYLARADDEITRQQKASQPARDDIYSAAFDKVRDLFVAYGLERGPPLAQLNILADGTSLKPLAIPIDATTTRRSRMEESNRLRKQIRDLDARYDAQAQVLMQQAQQEIDAELTRLQALAGKQRLEAENLAYQEAAKTVTKRQSNLDVELQHMVPTQLPAMAGHTVAVPGTTSLPAPPQRTDRPIFGSLEERRRLIEREIDIWIKTTGRRRSAGSAGAENGTDLFLQWRNAHKVGL